MNIHCCKCRKIIGRQSKMVSEQLQTVLQDILYTIIECPACVSEDSPELVTTKLVTVGMLNERLKKLEEDFLTSLAIRVRGLYNTISKQFKDQ